VDLAVSDLRTLDGRSIDVAPGSGHRVTLPAPPQLGADAAAFALLLRYLDDGDAVPATAGAA
jgi:hypothetical protein